MKIRICIFMTLAGVICSWSASAQPTKIHTAEIKLPSDISERAQNVFFELGGQGLQYSVNYDTRFSDRRNGFGGRAGIGFFTLKGKKIANIPLSLNYLLGKGRHFAEFGIGTSVLLSNSSENPAPGYFPPAKSIVYYTTNMSYRFQPIHKGLFLQTGVGPVFNTDFELVFYFGVGIGYTFK